MGLRAKCISQRSPKLVSDAMRQARGERHGARTALKSLAEQCCTSGSETHGTAVMFSPRIASRHYLFHIVYMYVATSFPRGPLRATHEFSLPRVMQFQINYASDWPRRVGGRRIIPR